MLSFVAFRNLIELSGSDFEFGEGFSLPKSFGWIRSGPLGASVLWTISYVCILLCFILKTLLMGTGIQPVLTVMVSEMLVDWLKHAFM